MPNRKDPRTFKRPLLKSSSGATLRKAATGRGAPSMFPKRLLLEALQEASHEGILTVDEHGTILSYNQRFITMWGIPPEVAQSRSDERALASVIGSLQDPDGFLRKVQYLYEHKLEKSHDQIALRDGRTFERYSAPICTPDGVYAGRVWFFRDVTALMRTGQELWLKDAAVAASINGIVIAELDGTIRYVNDALSQMTGRRREELVGGSVRVLWPGTDEEVVQELRVRGFWFGEVVASRSDGRRLVVQVSVSAVKDEQGEPIAMVASHVDVTERKQIEEDLWLKDAAMAASIDAIVITGLTGEIRYVNDAWVDLHGYTREEVVGRTAMDLWPEDAARFASALGNEPGALTEAVMRRKDGTPLQLQVSISMARSATGEPLAVMVSELDISERKRAEEERNRSLADLAERHAELAAANRNLKEMSLQVAHASRLAAVGELTAGIAHELNQPLNAIKITNQGLLRDLKKGRLEEASLVERLGGVVSLVDKMAEIILHMQVFTRKTSESDYEAVDLNDVVAGALSFFRQQLEDHGIELVLETSSLPLVIGANQVNLEQVLVNLISNARDALEAGGKERKTLVVRTRREGSAALAQVEDNGIGLSVVARERIFQPFFTTKEPGRGTGLGLSVAKKIVEEHRGTLSFESSEGQFASFQLSFPLVADTSGAERGDQVGPTGERFPWQQ